MVKISSYHSAFNLIKMGFDYKSALENYCQFFDEVVIAVNTSEDNTFKELQYWGELRGFNNLKLVSCDFDYSDLAFDGKIKDFAMKNCTNKFKCLLDLDERIPMFQRGMWNNLCLTLEKSEGIDGFLIASINLCHDEYHYKDIGYKFYLHSDTIKSRGIIPQAKKDNGKILIELSDTTEPLREDGTLGRFYPITNDINQLTSLSYPYVLHYWAVDDLEQRIRQNQMWKPVWENRSGESVSNILFNKQQIERLEVFEHKLPLN